MNQEFEVEIQRTITATVKVRAEDAESAAKIVNYADFPLPPDSEWSALKDWNYVVRNSSGEELYDGDAT